MINWSKYFDKIYCILEIENLNRKQLLEYELKRVGIEELRLNQAKKISDITTDDIIKIEDFLKLPSININPGFKKFVLNGIVLDERQTTLSGAFYVKCEDEIVAIYEEVDKNKYKPVLIFK